MSKHTPGTWRAVTGQGAHHRDWYIRCPKQHQPELGREGIAVAKTCSTGHNNGEVEANARLIAAAPDLLASLKAMVAQCGCDCCAGDKWSEAKESAKAAILAAEGNP